MPYTAPWILQSPLTASIPAMEAGGRLGLAVRDAALRERAQAAQEAEASDRLGLSFAEMQQRREQAAAQLAESLRQHNALEMYRQSELAHQKVLERQAQQQMAATQAHQALLQTNWASDHAIRAAAEKRLEESAKAAAEFEPGEPVPILVNGQPMGYRTQRSPHVWEQVKPVKPDAAKQLSPTKILDTYVRMAAPATLSEVGPVGRTTQLYKDRTNNLARAQAMLDATTAPKPNNAVDKTAVANEAAYLISQNPDKEDAIRSRYKQTFGEELDLGDEGE